MTRQELEKHLNNPNVRKMLDLISYSEGTTKHSYYTAFGGGRQESLATHENRKKEFEQTNGKKNKSGASGRYQFLKGTWDNVSKKYGLTDFSELSQDIGALALIAEKGQLNNVLKGDFTTAVSNLGGVWASFPSSNYPQPKHGWGVINEFLEKGTWKGKATSTIATPQVNAPQAQSVKQALIEDSTPKIPEVKAPSVMDFFSSNVQTDGTGSTVLSSPLGPVQASTQLEQKMFDDILASNPDPQTEKGLVVATQTISNAYNMLHKGGSSLLDNIDPLRSHIAFIFDNIKV